MLKYFLYVVVLLTIANCYSQNPFITTWTTESPFDQDNKTITIPVIGNGYNYTVDWGDGTTDEDVTESIDHTYKDEGIYTIKIDGDFPRIRVFDPLDPTSFKTAAQLLTIESWGNIEWNTFENAFYSAVNLVVKATDVPNLSNVKNMSGAFVNIKSIDSDITLWDVSTVENFSFCFAGVTTFNQDISNWNMSNAKDLSGMFNRVTNFNKPLGRWNVSSVVTMASMFEGATSFNQDLADWNVNQVQNMDKIFKDAQTFDQDLGDWDISSVTSMVNALSNSGMSTLNYDETLAKWVEKPGLQRDVQLGAVDIEYCNGISARDKLVDDYSWEIRDDILFCELTSNAFVTKWRTDNNGFSGDNEILINIDESLTYNYTIDWGDGQIENSMASIDIKHTYDVPGTYIISISGIFPRFISGESSNNNTDHEKLIDVLQWGNIQWSSMRDAFRSCVNMRKITASDTPNLSNVKDMSGMFESATNFTEGGLDNWDVSNVKDMAFTFASTDVFDEDISNWNTESLEVMKHMFRDALAFNQPIGDWDISKVNSLTETFAGAKTFNQPLNSWDTSNIVSLSKTFIVASSFNQPLDNWDVSNVTILLQCFSFSNFNQNINDWDVSNVQIFKSAFAFNDAFNQALDQWDVSSGQDFSSMFRKTTAFDQDLSDWNIKEAFSMREMFNESGMSIANYDATLIGWVDTGNPGREVSLGATGISFCEAKEARNILINNFGWTITDNGEDCTGALSVESHTVDPAKNFKIYPNPVQENLFIEALNERNDNRWLYEVFDLNGKLIVSDVYSFSGISVSSLIEGMYILKISDNKSNTSRKVFVKK